MFGIIILLQYQIDLLNYILIMFWFILEAYEHDWLHHNSVGDKNLIIYITDNYIDIWNELSLKIKCIQKQKETNIGIKSKKIIESKRKHLWKVLFFYNQYIDFVLLKYFETFSCVRHIFSWMNLSHIVQVALNCWVGIFLENI